MAEPKKTERMEVEVEVQHPADKVWTHYVHNLDKTIPAAMPGHFDELIYLEGTPLTPGSTLIATYHKDIPHYDFVKIRWDEINHDTYRFKCTLIDGGALNKYFSNLSYTFFLTPSPNPQSCVMHFVIEYMDLEEHTFHGFIKEEVKKFCNALNSYLNEVS